MRVVVLFRADLWRHVGATASEGARRISRLIRRCKPPVNDLQVEVRVEADILGLQIPVAIIMVLHPLDSLEKLAGHVANFMVLERLILHIFKELTHWSALLNSVDDLLYSATTLNIRAVLADAIKADDVFVGRAILERLQLSSQELHFSLSLSCVIERKNLDGV